MNTQEFAHQMQRLTDTFGKTAYSTERAKLIWSEVKEFPEAWLAKVCDDFIGTLRQAPLLTEFREKAAKYREAQYAEKSRNESTAWVMPSEYACSHCFDQGVYACEAESGPGVWAFRCHCVKGSQDPRKAIPQFKQAHLGKYFRIHPTKLMRPS